MENNPSNNQQHSHLTSAKAVSVVPRGGETDVRRENKDVRWVGFPPTEKWESKI